MKKSDIALILAVIIVIVIGVIFATGKEEKIPKPVTITGEAGFKETTYTEYEEAIKSEEPFVITFVKDGCSYCEQFQPIITKVSEDEKIPVKYLNISKLTEEESAKLYESNKFFKTNSDWGTPTTLVLKGEKVVDSLRGYAEEEDLKDFFKETVKVKQEQEDKEDNKDNEE